MDDISSFARTLTKLERLMAKLDMAVSNTRCMFGVKNMELTYDVSLRVAELMEKAVLVARALPAYTGAPDAAMMVAKQTASVVHVEIGFTDEGWFSLRMPLLLPKKEHGSADYIRSILFPEMQRFFHNQAPCRFKDCVLIYRHVYSRDRPERQRRDHDNIEINMVSDIVALYKEMRQVLEAKPIPQAEGIILGEKDGKAICLPVDTRLNRHITICGSSGTMKSRAVIRPALFNIIRRGESTIITDPKGEMYGDLAALFQQNGYEVRVFNLVNPQHGDSWNCMSDLNGDTLLAQVLTNVIIGNTSEGKGDHFWDNGEGNLLRALILYVDQDRTRSPDQKNLAAVYQLLTQNNERQLTAMFEKLPIDHPARAPFNLFSQASDTVRSGIILGLGTRLQVLQNEAVRRIISQNDIDLTAPGKRKCAYFVILSDQDATMAFLSSLFFSFLFIKLVRYADRTPQMRCAVPVNLVFDEFNNVGKLGGAADGSDFARTLSVIRSRAIYVMLAIQSLGQLQNRYPNNLWAEILGNTDVQLMLGCTDDISAEYFSARSGDMSIQINTTMTVRQTLAVAQMIPQYRHTEGQGKRRLLTPDEVLRLPNEELLVIIRGHNVLKLNKLDYTRLPMAAQIEKRSILDYTPQPSITRTIPEPGPEPKPERKKMRPSLYSSASPPEDF